MKSILKLLTLPIAASCVLGVSCRLAFADSTADLILNLRCQDQYKVQVWRNRTTNELMYRSQSPKDGNLAINKGTSRTAEGLRVYEFRRGMNRYSVWDGTLDSAQEGILEVYKNDRRLVERDCEKI